MEGTNSFNLSTNDKPKLTSKNAMSTALSGIAKLYHRPPMDSLMPHRPPSSKNKRKSPRISRFSLFLCFDKITFTNSSDVTKDVKNI
ncbi:hypothetical protein T08_12141 [Trichinella sp. T8]|nr:hypothetical protein T08_12141 [Trichinella sp. T8]